MHPLLNRQPAPIPDIFQNTPMCFAKTTSAIARLQPETQLDNFRVEALSDRSTVEVNRAPAAARGTTINRPSDATCNS